MKVSEKLPPVLMREYRDQNELMAVFTRPVGQERRWRWTTSLRRRRRAGAARAAAQRGGAQGGRRQRAAVRPARHRQDRAGQGGGAGGRAGAVRGRVRRPRRQFAVSGRDRYRSLQIAQVFLKGSAQAALLFDEVEDVFPPISSEAAQLMARAEQVVAPPNGSVSGKAWVNQILEIEPGADDLGHQPHRADRPGLPPPLRLPPGTEVAAAGRARGAGAQDAGGRRGVARPSSRKLTERKGLTPAQIRTAVRFAGLAQCRRQRPMESLIERQLRNADQALGTRARRRAARAAASPPTTWTCSTSSARFEVPRIVEALQGARPRHAVLLRRARHRQDRAGRAHRRRRWTGR